MNLTSKALGNENLDKMEGTQSHSSMVTLRKRDPGLVDALDTDRVLVRDLAGKMWMRDGMTPMTGESEALFPVNKQGPDIAVGVHVGKDVSDDGIELMIKHAQQARKQQQHWDSNQQQSTRQAMQQQMGEREGERRREREKGGKEKRRRKVGKKERREERVKEERRKKEGRQRKKRTNRSRRT